MLAGLIGYGIQASRTPRMHTEEGAALGLRYDYRLIDLSFGLNDAELAVLLNGLEDAGYRGINVTVPYKRSILPHLAALSDDARIVGAVNTVLFTKNGLLDIIRIIGDFWKVCGAACRTLCATRCCCWAPVVLGMRLPMPLSMPAPVRS